MQSVRIFSKGDISVLNEELKFYGIDGKFEIEFRTVENFDIKTSNFTEYENAITSVWVVQGLPPRRVYLLGLSTKQIFFIVQFCSQELCLKKMNPKKNKLKIKNQSDFKLNCFVRAIARTSESL